MKSHHITLLAAILVAATLAACSGFSDDDPYHRPVDPDGPTPGEQEAVWILLDHYHARKQNPVDYRMDRQEFAYQGVFAYWRLFDHLDRQNYRWAEIREMELSEERLEGFDVLFINLLSSDRPDFTDEEVTAIMRFVERGGGLFVIADHTNVYRHGERVNRFLEPMGIEVLFHTIVDYPPDYSISGMAWLMVRSFADHPVTADIEVVSPQTGGPLAAPEGGGVAFTSERSFGDLWDPEDKHGYYGDWTHNGDEEVEPKGPLNFIVAREYGQGRVVVVGDQNIFGDAWVHYADNLEVALNSFEWLAGRNATGSPLRHTRPRGTVIGYEQPHSKFSGGQSGPDAFFALYTNANRDDEITGHGTFRLDNREDALVFLNPTAPFDDDDLDRIAAYFEDGKTVVITFEADELVDSHLQFLERFAPEFDLTAMGDTVRLDEPAAMKNLEVGRIPRRLPLDSDLINVDDLELASYEVTPTGDADKNEDEGALPYLLDVNSSWGESFVSAETPDGRHIDIARRARVDRGELIVFVQDGFWRNRTFGDYLRRPNEFNRPAHELHFRFQDYLKVDEGSY